MTGVKDTENERELVGNPARHRLSAICGDMSEDEYRGLCSSIRDEGLAHPVVLLDGDVLDGWHRLLACRDAGEPVRVVDYVGSHAGLFVLRENVHRRAMNAARRIEVLREGRDWAPVGKPEPSNSAASSGGASGTYYPEGETPVIGASGTYCPVEPQDGPPDYGDIPDYDDADIPLTIDAAAEQAGVSRDTVKRFKKASEHDDLKAEMLSGEKSIKAAAQEADRRAGKSEPVRPGTHNGREIPKTQPALVSALCKAWDELDKANERIQELEDSMEFGGFELMDEEQRKTEFGLLQSRVNSLTRSRDSLQNHLAAEKRTVKALKKELGR